jgi:hypothetical protein
MSSSEFDPELGDKQRVERVATWLSLACAVHCLALPLVTSFAPLFKLGVLASPWIDALLVASVIVFATVSTWFGFRRHRDVRVLAAVGLALMVYLVGHVAEGAPYGPPLTVVGALSLSLALFVGTRRAHVHAAHCEH